MWLLTTTGFFSVVAHRDPQLLVVRARVRADLETLRDRHLAGLEIVETADADYRFRAFVPRRDFQRAVAALAADIDYPNFKHAVAERQGHARAHVYAAVWSTLYGLEHARSR